MWFLEDLPSEFVDLPFLVLASGYKHPQRYDGFPCWPLHSTGVTYVLTDEWLMAQQNLPLLSTTPGTLRCVRMNQ